jgi:dienelactone hydrolase
MKSRDFATTPSLGPLGPHWFVRSFTPISLCGVILVLAACANHVVSPRFNPTSTAIRAGVGSAYIEVSPGRPLVDERLSINIGGLPPYQFANVTADARDHLGRAWQSYAVFRANEHGEVDLASEKPEAGTYNVVDSMGLFWSLHLMDSGGSGDMNFEDDVQPEPMPVTFTVEAGGKPVASTSILRETAAAGVTRIPVNQNGLAGILYKPAGPGPHPCIIILAGAEGGLHSDQAALLASHGFASLALAYFAYDGLPATLEHIPIEYFETAIHWLQQQDGVRADRLAVVGASRGGELGLLLGSTFPEIKAVVAYVPASYLGPGDNGQGPAWTFHGKSLPYVPDFDTIFAAARGDPAATLKASNGLIRVERIHGPVLLISAKDDRLWPSFLMSGEIMQRLAQLHHPYPDKHLSYEGAGHLILQMIPFLPYTAQRDPVNVARYINYYGGTTAGDALAEEDSWPQVISFLSENLK